jgi:hypothetical protein
LLLDNGTDQLDSSLPSLTASDFMRRLATFDFSTDQAGVRQAALAWATADPEKSARHIAQFAEDVDLPLLTPAPLARVEMPSMSVPDFARDFAPELGPHWSTEHVAEFRGEASSRRCRHSSTVDVASEDEGEDSTADGEGDEEAENEDAEPTDEEVRRYGPRIGASTDTAHSGQRLSTEISSMSTTSSEPSAGSSAPEGRSRPRSGRDSGRSSSG